MNNKINHDKKLFDFLTTFHALDPRLYKYGFAFSYSTPKDATWIDHSGGRFTLDKSIDISIKFTNRIRIFPEYHKYSDAEWSIIRRAEKFSSTNKTKVIKWKYSFQINKKGNFDVKDSESAFKVLKEFAKNKS